MVKIFLSFRMFWYKSVCKLPIELPTKTLIKLKGYHYAKKDLEILLIHQLQLSLGRTYKPSTYLNHF